MKLWLKSGGMMVLHYQKSLDGYLLFDNLDSYEDVK